MAISWPIATGSSDNVLQRPVGNRSEAGAVTTLTAGDVTPIASSQLVQLDRALEQRASMWVRSQLDALLAMPADWDARGGRPIALAVAAIAEVFLSEVIANGVPSPAIVPTPDGGLSLEWYAPAMELVISIPAVDDPVRAASAFFFDEAMHVEWEHELIEAASNGLTSALERFRDAG